MNIWLRLSATFHEHPKMLAVRTAAGTRADSAELGWYRLLMAAKRYGRWTFASEDHLAHVAGTYYRFVPLYRSARLLDDLTVHDGDNYNAMKTDAERKAEQRERDRMSRPHVTPPRDMPRDQNVTLDNRHTERTDREDTERAPANGLPNLDRPAIEALEDRTGHLWSQAGERQLSEYDRLVGDHGLDAVLGAFDAVRDGKRLTARQLIWPAMKLLEPFATIKVVEDDGAAERAAIKARRVQEETWRRREESYRFTGQWEAEWGEPPKVTA